MVLNKKEVKRKNTPGKVKMPVDAVVAVTYRCNSRCIMCDIWKIKDYPELAPSVYKKLPPSLKDINISGGEPFLRLDLDEIIKVVKATCPKARIIISTNGFLVERTKKMIKKLLEIDPKIGINISIDGYEDMHEQIRRVPNAWEKDTELLRFCKKIGVHNLGLAFTLNNENYQDTRKLYDYAKEHGYKFTMAVAQTSEHYFGSADYQTNVMDQQMKKEFDYIIKKMLKGLKPKEWARAYFVNGLYNIATGQKPPLPSSAGNDYFYLDPKGDIYPSVADNVVMGNFHDFHDFKEFWYSPQAQQARDNLQGFESDYWFVCTARQAIKRNPLKVARWIFEKKALFK